MEQGNPIEILQKKIAALEQLPEVAEYIRYKQTLDTFQILIKESEGKNGTFRPTINGTGNTTAILSSTPNKRNEVKISKKKLVASVLKEEARFLHVREIVELTQKKDSSADENSIRQAVYQLKIDGSIVSHAINKSNINTFWGSPDWLDAKGEPKAEHKYNEAYITKKESIKI